MDGAVATRQLLRRRVGSGLVWSGLLYAEFATHVKRKTFGPVSLASNQIDMIIMQG